MKSEEKPLEDLGEAEVEAEKTGEEKGKMNDWVKIFVGGIIGAVVGGMLSFGATYYKHGREIQSVAGDVKLLTERLNATDKKLDGLNITSSNPLPKPSTIPATDSKIEIISPSVNAVVDVQRSNEAGNLACFYTVRGTSVNVWSNNEVGWYVLVRPKGGLWYVQTDESDMNPTGEWTVRAWIGNKKNSPKAGEIFQVAAIITEPFRVEGKSEVKDLKELKPKATSLIADLKVGNIQ